MGCPDDEYAECIGERLQMESGDGQDAAWDLLGAVCSRLGQSSGSSSCHSMEASQPVAPLMMTATAAACGGDREAMMSDCNAAAAVAEGLRKFASEEPVPPGALFSTPLHPPFP